MPLPTIETPKYPVTIPSSKKKTFFRPFLMKEQKILFMALESENQEQIFHAICDIVKNCVSDVPNPATMPMFDLEYLFTKIRAKSVGEFIEVKVKCPNCQKSMETSVELETVDVEFPSGITNKVMINQSVGIILRYPSLKDTMKDLDNLGADGVVKFICESIESVFDNENVYTKKDFTDQEIGTFVESMNVSQFEEIAKFYKNLPQLKKTVNCNCISCKSDFTIDFRGLQDFFT